MPWFLSLAQEFSPIHLCVCIQHFAVKVLAAIVCLPHLPQADSLPKLGPPPAKETVFVSGLFSNAWEEVPDPPPAAEETAGHNQPLDASWIFCHASSL